MEAIDSDDYSSVGPSLHQRNTGGGNSNNTKDSDSKSMCECVLP